MDQCSKAILLSNDLLLLLQMDKADLNHVLWRRERDVASGKLREVLERRSFSLGTCVEEWNNTTGKDEKLLDANVWKEYIFKGINIRVTASMLETIEQKKKLLQNKLDTFTHTEGSGNVSSSSDYSDSETETDSSNDDESQKRFHSKECEESGEESGEDSREDSREDRGKERRSRRNR